MLSFSEGKVFVLDYLGKEGVKHHRDAILAEGKNQEIQELIAQIKETCSYCGERIYAYGEKDGGIARMANHLQERHKDALEAEMERQENNRIA